MDSTIDQLLLRGQQGGSGDGLQSLISAPEAERMIDQLQAFAIEDVGSARWNTQHDWIERLNIQAHYNAQIHSDEFVVEQLVSLDKMKVLVHDLLVIEAWKQKVFPHLAQHLAHKVDNVVSHMLAYHEGAVANLLEVTLYHSHACEAVPEDYLLELADWCYRKLAYLNTEARVLADARDRSAQELMAMKPEEEMHMRNLEVDFGVAMCSLTILRYLTDNVTSLPMGLLSRVVSTNDIIMSLVPLLDSPPWVRMRPGRLEKFVDNKWQATAAADRFKLTQPDAQVWLALNNLVVEPKCRAKYHYDDYRRDKLLTLKRFMNELLFDQLPVLKDLQRVLDEIALGMMGDAAAQKGASLILEQVPTIREGLLRGKDWRAIALQQAKEYFGEASKRMARERAEQMLKAFEFLCDMQPGPQEGAEPGSSPGQDSTVGPVKVDCYRKAHQSGIWEPWCDLTLDIDSSKPPDPVEVSDGAHKVHGLRYRLKALDADSNRPFPCKGKVVVRSQQLAAEALLQLPEVPLRSSNDHPAVLWVTVGRLAAEGLALQIKMKKADKPRERDKVAGVWYAYHPVGGALTLINHSKESTPGKGAGHTITATIAPVNHAKATASNTVHPGKPALQQTTKAAPVDAVPAAATDQQAADPLTDADLDLPD